jgi:hypothetical protein
MREPGIETLNPRGWGREAGCEKGGIQLFLFHGTGSRGWGFQLGIEVYSAGRRLCYELEELIRGVSSLRECMPPPQLTRGIQDKGPRPKSSIQKFRFRSLIQRKWILIVVSRGRVSRFRGLRVVSQGRVSIMIPGLRLSETIQWRVPQPQVSSPTRIRREGIMESIPLWTSPRMLLLKNLRETDN